MGIGIVKFENVRVFDKRLRIIIGDRGSGKTNTALVLAERLRKRVTGVDFIIPANVNPYPDDDFIIRPLGTLSSFRKYLANVRDRVVIIDEGLIAVNARNRQSGFGTTLAKLSAVARHVNVYIIITTQAHLVDRQLRMLADAVLVKNTSLTKFVLEDRVPNWVKKIDKALERWSRGRISLSSIPVTEAVLIEKSAYYVIDIPKSRLIDKLGKWARKYKIELRVRYHGNGKVNKGRYLIILGVIDMVNRVRLKKLYKKTSIVVDKVLDILEIVLPYIIEKTLEEFDLKTQYTSLRETMGAKGIAYKVLSDPVLTKIESEFRYDFMETYVSVKVPLVKDYVHNYVLLVTVDIEVREEGNANVYVEYNLLKLVSEGISFNVHELRDLMRTGKIKKITNLRVQTILSTEDDFPKSEKKELAKAFLKAMYGAFSRVK